MKDNKYIEEEKSVVLVQWKSNICKVEGVPFSQQRLIVIQGGSYELLLGKLETSENTVWGVGW